ncbi:hypothetical protein [Streptomyces flaveolus]|uniref:hypothetical protein n=1 Tax=Streptomyces flaveolus TaxID=67297 RepID=UPI0033220B19
MTITGEKLNDWIESMSSLADQFMQSFEDIHGFEPDENELIEAGELREVGHPALHGMNVPNDLSAFYSRVEEVSLPDVGNGIFIHSPEFVAAGLAGEQPTRLAGSVVDSITVFGSDGGGGLLALGSDGCTVYHLSGGSLIGPTYETDSSNVRITASSLWEFLEQVRSELKSASDRDG